MCVTIFFLLFSCGGEQFSYFSQHTHVLYAYTKKKRTRTIEKKVDRKLLDEKKNPLLVFLPFFLFKKVLGVTFEKEGNKSFLHDQTTGTDTDEIYTGLFAHSRRARKMVEGSWEESHKSDKSQSHTAHTHTDRVDDVGARRKHHVHVHTIR